MQPHTPAVSVLMTVHNGLPYVRETLASIRAQTFTDWEFVVVDDASTDGTGEVLRAAAAVDPRIRVFENSIKLGASGGANRGLCECNATWIARIDADDVALPERLERQMMFVAENPDVKVTSSLAYYINGEGVRVGKTYHDLTTREIFREYVASNRIVGIMHPGALIDKQTIESVGAYREDFGPAHDVDLWSRIADTGALILVQPEYLMEYRVHSESMSARMFDVARHKKQWARACMIARREGKPEPAWEAFFKQLTSAPWWWRLNQWRKGNAKRLYRQSGLHFISGRKIVAMAEMGIAGLLLPLYTFKRIRGQLLR